MRESEEQAQKLRDAHNWYRVAIGTPHEAEAYLALQAIVEKLKGGR